MSTWKSAKSWEAPFLESEGISNEIQLDPETGKMVFKKSIITKKQGNKNPPEDVIRVSQKIALNKSIEVLQTPQTLLPENVFPVLCDSNIDELDILQIIPCTMIQANKSPNFVRKWLDKSTSTIINSSNLKPKKTNNQLIVPQTNSTVLSHNTNSLNANKTVQSNSIDNIINSIRLSGEISRGRSEKKM